MTKLQEAYQFFRLQPGCSFDEAKRRYKRMALAWHPDRMATDEARKDAEEEMKLINHFFEILDKHYQTGHKETGPCECRQTATSGNARQDRKTGPDPEAERQWRDRQKKAEEEAAKKMDEQRRQREAEEEARRKEEEARRRAEATRREMQDAVRERSAFKDERLRWQIAVGACACLVTMIVLGSICTGIHSWWDGVSAQWRNQSVPYEPQNSPNTGFTAYIPPYERIPGANSLDGQNTLKAQAEDERRKKREQDLYFAKLEVDRNEKTIQQCNSNIAQLSTQIANPLISNADRGRLQELKSFQERCRQDAQQNLQAAKERLTSM